MTTSNHMQDDWANATCQVLLDAVDDHGQTHIASCQGKPYALVGASMLCKRHYEEIKDALKR